MVGTLENKTPGTFVALGPATLAAAMALLDLDDPRSGGAPGRWAGLAPSIYESAG